MLFLRKHTQYSQATSLCGQSGHLQSWCAPELSSFGEDTVLSISRQGAQSPSSRALCL